MKLSVVIITFNEERNIERCLKSAQAVADEIVVVDSFSVDRTEEICRKYGVLFIENPFEGHIQQKNFALSQANHEWVLSLDADECLDDRLTAEILLIKEQQPEYAGYSMNRLTNYCGHWVRHSGWYPDVKLRLAKNASARFVGENPHDYMIVDGAVKHLKGDILHYSYYTREDHLKQIEYFSSIAAKELHQKGKGANWFLVAVKVFAQFIKSYFIKLGVLDGATGFTISRLSAFATFRKYSKLRALSKGYEVE